MRGAARGADTPAPGVAIETRRPAPETARRPDCYFFVSAPVTASDT